MLKNAFLHLCILSFLIIGCKGKTAQKNKLEQEIESILSEKRATVGVYASTGKEEIISINDSLYFPLMSVFKYHIALTVLDHLNKHAISLNSPVYIQDAQLEKETYSPLRDENRGEEFTISLEELLTYSVAHSDNNACDILIEYVGGTTVVNNYIKSWGVDHTSIIATEKQMNKDIKSQYLNEARPSAVTHAMQLLSEQPLFAEYYKEFLIKTMQETTTGSNKLKGLLPPNTIVAHKTGSSSRTAEGMKIADNDAGFVYLPDGNIYYITVLIKNSQEDDETNAGIIAQISKAVYEYMVNSKE